MKIHHIEQYMNRIKIDLHNLKYIFLLEYEHIQMLRLKIFQPTQQKNC
jgi:hypothetical protein